MIHHIYVSAKNPEYVDRVLREFFTMKGVARLVALSSLFIGAVAASADIASGNQFNRWDTTAITKRSELGRDITYNCPPNGKLADVWGTDIYSDDSSICSAAVHAGLITTRHGGRVTIRIKPGQSSYTGTDRNSVSSQDYGSWDGSFIFLNRGRGSATN